jgi:hypothetical protein
MSELKLDDIVKIKTIVPQYPSHMFQEVISNRLTYITIYGKISSIDKITYMDKIMYTIKFNSYLNGELCISEEDLLNLISR